MKSVGITLVVCCRDDSSVEQAVA